MTTYGQNLNKLRAALLAWRAYQEEGLRQQVHIHSEQVEAGKPIDMVAYRNKKLDELYSEANRLTEEALGPFESEKIISEEFVAIYGQDSDRWVGKEILLGKTLSE